MEWDGIKLSSKRLFPNDVHAAIKKELVGVYGIHRRKQECISHASLWGRELKERPCIKTRFIGLVHVFY